ncbi:MAG: PHP domain-containing protein, partial [Eubacteriales bacterium]|nr:PHP domain-containing protein [Eubacteriales bacterium]
DLHLHTIYSDGSDEPEEILRKADRLGLQYISITDHDSLAAYEELSSRTLSRRFGGVLIPGCEFSVAHDKMPIEVLGYGIDFEVIRASGLVSEEWFLERENQYIGRMKEICRNLNLKLTESLSIKNGKAFATQIIHGDLRKYPENEKFFTSEIWSSVNAFYRTCINNEDSPLFLNQIKDYPTLKEITGLIKKAGGKSFLAHLYGYFTDDHMRFLDSLVSLHLLDGIECYHSLHSQSHTNSLLNYCSTHGLYASGGSDYHGALKPDVLIGETVDGIHIPFEILEPWLK